MARTLRRFIKDPNATLNYTIKWDRWLRGDVIIASTWVVPAGLTQEFADNSGSDATILLSGGTDGQEYVVTNRVTTRQGLIDDRSIAIKVQEL